MPLPVGGPGGGSLPLATPDLRRLAKSWLGAQADLPGEAIVEIADAKFASHLHGEKTLAALILAYSEAARHEATPARVEAWLDQLAGWAQIDALCSNVFQAEQFLDDWPSWGAWLRGLATDSNINKRRASLVLLTGPVRKSDDPRLRDLSLENIAQLQAERAILVTKAVSWLLRNLTIRHKGAVTDYLEANRAKLPAIAVRETLTKLATGRKQATRPR